MAEVYGLTTLTTSTFAGATPTNSAGSVIQASVALFTPVPTASGGLPGTSNATATTNWEPSPRHRGTFSIVTTCVATLLLCIWTGLHLNVPKTQRRALTEADTTWTTSLGRVARRKGFWMLAGLLAPELFVYMAWYQFILARKLKVLMNQRLEEHGDKFKWTMTHSFFALMGGIHGHRSDADRYEAVTLTPDGIAKHFDYQRSHALKDRSKRSDLLMDRSTIEDRSKADSLAKFLVCMQATYVTLQVGSRLRSRLPITLLEINTVGHIVCALAMYGFWWYKPLEVKEPVFLECEWLEGEETYWTLLLQRRSARSILCLEDRTMIKIRSELKLFRAFVARAASARKFATEESYRCPATKKMSSWARGDQDRFVIIVSNTDEEPRPSPNFDVGARDSASDYLNTTSSLSNTSSESVILGNFPNIRSLVIGSATNIYSTTERKIQSQLAQLSKKSTKHERVIDCIYRAALDLDDRGTYASRTAPDELVAVVMTTERRKLWEATLAAMGDTHSMVSTRVSSEEESLGNENTLIADHIPNWPDIRILGSVKRYGPFIAIAFASGLYGGLHLSAWNIYFPSMIEQRLWRISGTIIAGTGVLLAISILFFWLARWLAGAMSAPRVVIEEVRSESKESIADGASSEETTFVVQRMFWFGFTKAEFVTVLFIYSLARSFIVVEAFISLRRLPVGAYDIPSWMVWWPVFGSA